MTTIRFFFLALALSLFASMQAQTDAKAKQQVNEIRRQYAEAKQMAAQNDKPDMDYYNDLEMKSRKMVGGAGMVYETVRYFFLTDFDEDAEMEYSKVYLITRRYHVGACNYYEEYLFDIDSGQLIFAFLQGDNASTGQKDETRYYWGPEGLVHQQVKGEPIMDDVFTQRTASDLILAFNLVENRNY